MSWFEKLLGKKPEADKSIRRDRQEPSLVPPVSSPEEKTNVAFQAKTQQEADDRAAQLVLARLKGELPGREDQEHIDLPLENEALKNERTNHEQLMKYIMILKQLESAVGDDTPGELELSQPLFDAAFKEAAAAIKALNRHPDATELSIMSGLIVMVRDRKLAQLIAMYEGKREESIQKIKELQGDTTVQNTREALKKNSLDGK